MTGETRFKESLARMMQRWIFDHHAHINVKADYLRVQAGVGSVVAQLSYLLGDPKDGVLVTGPTYPAFPQMVKVHGQLVLHVCPTSRNNGYLPTLQDLDAGFNNAIKAGNPPRIFIICQPQNPLGIVYKKETMRLMITWALEKGLHVVSDEIYALSIFPGQNRMISAAEVMRDINIENPNKYLGDYVHIVCGMSKDWAMAGFRIGWVFSHNKDLLQGLDMLGPYQASSQYTQHAITSMLNDEAWVASYVEKYQQQLLETYQALERALALIQVPICVAPQGALFVWADFSSYLRENQTEKDLWVELYREAKVMFTLGESCFGEKPGLFRIVYTWPEGGSQAMEELGKRLVLWKERREASS